MTFYMERTGTTRAVRSVEINARVTGVLESMHFEPGTMVREGDLLFIIEPRLYKATWDAAEAAVKSSEAELARTEADLQRIELAIQTDAVSRSDLDLARANRDMAAATVLAKEASLDQAELRYSYTEVKAPLNGLISRNLVDVGNVVGGSGPIVLATINQMQPIHAYFESPEEVVVLALERLGADPTRIKDADPIPVHVATLADQGYVHEGIVDFIANTVDAATGTIEIRAVIPNEDISLFPGLFIRVRVPMETVPDGILVREEAVGTDLGGRFVYVLGDDNLIGQTYVTVGTVEDDGMVPVLDGLDGSETYVVTGLLRARPGMPATPKPAESDS